MRHGTCSHCGYEMEKCQCGHKRNTSGDVASFSHYTNYSDEKNMFSMTTPHMYQRDEEANKFFEEILPINTEDVKVWIERTQVHTTKLTEYSRNQHIYGTRTTWACHKSSRYCFICTLCDFVDVLRMFIQGIQDLFPDKPIHWVVDVSKDGRSSYHVSL